MKNPKSFSIVSSYLLLENRFKIKSLMNFEPVFKRAVVCFLTHAQQYILGNLREYWGPILYQVHTILWSAARAKSKHGGGIDRISLRCH